MTEELNCGPYMGIDIVVDVHGLFRARVEGMELSAKSLGALQAKIKRNMTRILELVTEPGARALILLHDDEHQTSLLHRVQITGRKRPVPYNCTRIQLQVRCDDGALHWVDHERLWAPDSVSVVRYNKAAIASTKAGLRASAEFDRRRPFFEEKRS